MKVLICGMTASQSSYSLSRRNVSFAGMLNDALVESNVEVVWADPAVSWTAEHFDEYDSVLVGGVALSIRAEETPKDQAKALRDVIDYLESEFIDPDSFSDAKIFKD